MPANIAIFGLRVAIHIAPRPTLSANRRPPANSQFPDVKFVFTAAAISGILHGMNEPIISVEPRDKAIVTRVRRAELDHDSTQSFKTELKSIIAAHPELPIILDMEEVEFLPSIALGALVEIHLNLKRNGRRFALAALRPSIEEIMTLSGLNNLLQIYQQTDAAIAQA
ncbi:MAG TPA: STAS domain-containing protein [Phycisphaerae bacterium]|nr:STAS domain-containing protein [Phycisphaerae bacterium]HRW52371.1 STAS domain-containing protein [Phycisphaerae bacterium]